jgi:hypothetical protein
MKEAQAKISKYKYKRTAEDIQKTEEKERSLKPKDEKGPD